METGVPEGFLGLDIGPKSIAMNDEAIKKSKTIVSLQQSETIYIYILTIPWAEPYFGRFVRFKSLPILILAHPRIVDAPCQASPTFDHSKVWNGPMGVFEMKAFEKGTKQMMPRLKTLECCYALT